MNPAVLDQIVAAFQQAASPMLRNLTPYLLLILSLTFVVQTAWDLLTYVVDDRHLIPMVVRKILGYSFLFFIATNLATFLPMVLETFVKLGGDVAGLSRLSPEALFRQGLGLATALYQGWGTQFSRLLPGIGLFPQVAFFLVAGAFALVALQVLRTLIEAALALSGLAVFLGFWGLRLTRGLSDGYFRFLLEVGARLYTLFLVIAVGQDFATDWTRELLNLQTFDPLAGFTVVLASVTFAFVAWSVPNHLGRLVARTFSFDAPTLEGGMRHV